MWWQRYMANNESSKPNSCCQKIKFIRWFVRLQWFLFWREKSRFATIFYSVNIFFHFFHFCLFYEPSLSKRNPHTSEGRMNGMQQFDESIAYPSDGSRAMACNDDILPRSTRIILDEPSKLDNSTVIWKYNMHKETAKTRSNCAEVNVL